MSASRKVSKTWKCNWSHGLFSVGQQTSFIVNVVHHILMLAFLYLLHSSLTYRNTTIVLSFTMPSGTETPHLVPSSVILNSCLLSYRPSLQYMLDLLTFRVFPMMGVDIYDLHLRELDFQLSF